MTEQSCQFRRFHGQLAGRPASPPCAGSEPTPGFPVAWFHQKTACCPSGRRAAGGQSLKVMTEYAAAKVGDANGTRPRQLRSRFKFCQNVRSPRFLGPATCVRQNVFEGDQARTVGPLCKTAHIVGRKQKIDRGVSPKLLDSAPCHRGCCSGRVNALQRAHDPAHARDLTWSGARGTRHRTTCRCRAIKRNTRIWTNTSPQVVDRCICYCLLGIWSLLVIELCAHRRSRMVSVSPA